MSAGICSSALDAIAGVSACSVTFTSVMALSEKVTSTVTAPFMPLAEAVYVPALKVAANAAGIRHSSIVSATNREIKRFFIGKNPSFHACIIPLCERNVKQAFSFSS